MQQAVDDAVAAATNGEGLRAGAAPVTVPVDALFTFARSAVRQATYGGVTFSASSTAPGVVSVSTTADGPGVVLTPGGDGRTATVSVDARPGNRAGRRAGRVGYVRGGGAYGGARTAGRGLGAAGAAAVGCRVAAVPDSGRNRMKRSRANRRLVIMPGETPVKAFHFTELRERSTGCGRRRVGLLRLDRSGPVGRGDGDPARAPAGVALGPRGGVPGGGTAGAGVDRQRAEGGGDPVRAAHLMELRAAVVALE